MSRSSRRKSMKALDLERKKARRVNEAFRQQLRYQTAMQIKLYEDELRELERVVLANAEQTGVDPHWPAVQGGVHPRVDARR